MKLKPSVQTRVRLQILQLILSSLSVFQNLLVLDGERAMNWKYALQELSAFALRLGRNRALLPRFELHQKQ